MNVNKNSGHFYTYNIKIYFVIIYRNTNNMKDLSGKMKETKDNATDAETLCIGK